MLVGAVALELLGRHAEAIRAADEAVRLMPESRDAVNGPTVAIQRAWVLIHGRGARAEEGYAEFERLLGAYMLNPREVAAEPLWPSCATMHACSRSSATRLRKSRRHQMRVFSDRPGAAVARGAPRAPG